MQGAAFARRKDILPETALRRRRRGRTKVMVSRVPPQCSRPKATHGPTRKVTLEVKAVDVGRCCWIYLDPLYVG
jgi:hypothetical protein